MALSRSALLIYSAATLNCGVVLATTAVRGWNSAGIHAVARNSARFSALWFMVAFAAPGLVRFIRGLPSAATLLWAWCAAHMVHFASVQFCFRFLNDSTSSSMLSRIFWLCLSDLALCLAPP